ncbi:MAG: hypothetical protein DRQ78_04580 [Epsilonproteobacteria bacterium]|nr:MAG: hypothetical protein DRQ78_04580 [Campylobacterota bacterium]
MATTEYCGTPVNIPTGMDGELDVIDKYEKLMAATIADGSLYMRTKETFYELFKDLDLDSEEKAKMVSESMAQLAGSMSGASMQTALSWAKEERDGEYTLAILHGQALESQAKALLTQAAICEMESKTDNLCAQREVMLAGSMRENGRVMTYDAEDTCKPILLMDEGLKYHQTEMVIGQRYGILSDTYMKNGRVTIDDQGLPVTTDGAGKVTEDIRFSIRQRISFEDSKRNHAANASSQMISGLLAAEVVTDDHQSLIDQWVAAMTYLNADSPCPTPIAGPGCDQY